MLRGAITVLACTALLTGGLTGVATAAPPESQVQEMMDRTVRSGVPGVLAVTRDGNRSWRGTSGVGDIDTERAPRAGGQFRIASISKTFTATLVLQLAGEGRFGLDDHVQDLLPGLLPYPEPITVRQLLQHTSGVPRDLPPGPGWDSIEDLITERYSSFTPEEVVKLSTSQPLLFEPGTSWSYSNTGYTVLALLVEKVAGKPVEQVLLDRIIRPLHLGNTALVRDYPFLPGAATRGYEQLYPPPRDLTDLTEYNYSRYVGSGSMISSAPDLNRFFRALFGGRLLPPDLLAQMKQTVPMRTPDGQESILGYGLGLMRLPLDGFCPGGPAVWGHGGDLLGYGSWSMHTEDGRSQVSTVINQNLSVAPVSKSWHLSVVAAEFCELPGTAALSAPRLPQAGPLATLPAR